MYMSYPKIILRTFEIEKRNQKSGSEYRKIKENAVKAKSLTKRFECILVSRKS